MTAPTDLSHNPDQHPAVATAQQVTREVTAVVARLHAATDARLTGGSAP